MALIKYFKVFVCVIFIILANSTFLLSQEAVKGVVLEVGDIENKDKQDIEKIRDILKLNKEQADIRLSQQYSNTIKNINESLTKASIEIKNANKRFDQQTTKEAGKRLLNDLINIYDRLLNNFDKLPNDLIQRAIESLENKTAEGIRTTEDAIKRNEEAIDYQARIMKNRLSKLKKLKQNLENGSTSVNDRYKYRQGVNFIKKLHRKIENNKKSKKLFEKIRDKFAKVFLQKKEALFKMDSAVQSINHLKMNLADQLTILLQLDVLDRMDTAFSTKEFDINIDEIIASSDNFIDTIEEPFDNVFAGVFDIDDDNPDIANESESPERNINIDLNDKELAEIMNQY